LAQVVEARAGLRADGHDLGLGNDLPPLLHGERERHLVHGVGLRDRDDAL
jgi:hypothetical protein